jgi:hypothetical protein
MVEQRYVNMDTQVGKIDLVKSRCIASKGLNAHGGLSDAASGSERNGDDKSNRKAKLGERPRLMGIHGAFHATAVW